MGKLLRWYITFLGCLIALIMWKGLSSSASPDVPTRNVNSYGGLLSAVTKVASNYATLLITDLQTIPAGNAVTIDPNTTIQFVQGVQGGTTEVGINVAAGATLYYNGRVIAGQHRLFWGSGASSFGSGVTQGWVYDWWSGTTYTAYGKVPGTTYDIDIAGAARVQSINVDGTAAATTLTGTLAVSYLSGTIDNANLPDPYSLDSLTASNLKSGASPINSWNSGASLTASELNTIILQDGSESTVYGLPFISGVTVTYFKFIIGAAGGGVTLYNATGDQPFHGDGISGTSYYAIPPGYPFATASVYGVSFNTPSGLSTYWYVEDNGYGVAGD